MDGKFVLTEDIQKQIDKQIEDHKLAVMLVDEFDELAKKGEFHRLPDLNKLAGLPNEGFCIICMKGNQDLAQKLWSHFNLTHENMYYICVMYNLYTEVLLKGKLNVAEWIYSILSECTKEELRKILQHAIYYCSLKGSPDVCNILFGQLFKLFGVTDVQSMLDCKENIKDIVNNAVLYAYKEKRYNNVSKLFEMNLVSQKTINKVSYNNPSNSYLDFDVDFVDPQNKIPYIDTLN